MTSRSSIKRRHAKSQARAQHKPSPQHAKERLEQKLLAMRRHKAQAILGHENREKHARIEERAKSLRGKNRIEKMKQNRKQNERRQAPGTPALPHGRCKDWMIHGGDVHYASNGSSFKTYTKIDIHASNALGIGMRVLGIGKVFLQAKQADESDKITGLTLHDVLHIRGMPCNGISYSRLIAANVDIENVPSGDLVARNPSGVPMFRTEAEFGVYRLVLNEDPEGESPLAGLDYAEDDMKDFLSISAIDAAQVARIGQASRDIQIVERRDGFRPWKDGFEVEC